MRRIARERVVQALYASEFHPEDAMSFIAEHGTELEGEARDFYFRLSRGALEHSERIDEVIRRFLKKGWTLERVSSVDRAILRMAVYELLMEPETPPAVVINEAVELAKAFGGDDSGRFINGLLGSVIPKLDELRAEAGTS